ncbi:MAG: hypothetical protein JWP65_1870 [Ramlibacter sp.]|jgi:hypothetical protein|uniref:hypothetical protein n=1 Tax=Ramlibacter sp. TaxID=1917967 RepID=UPI0026111290|nr:hypothetical protein [Ramlibacter sp.]MDB5751449.1 hypothetical protein [Ramlibacter sp.]
MTQGADPKLLDALSRASSLELFQLQTIIERMLADPKRIIAVRLNMHLGQTVRFLDRRDGQMRSGKVVDLRDTQLVLHEPATKREWKLPYAAIEPPAAGVEQGSAEPAAPPATPLPQRSDFRCGERVAFEDRYLTTQVGIITRINQRTATIDTGDGQSWRVGFGLLRHVVDI